MKVTLLEDPQVLTRCDWADRLRAWSFAMGVTSRQKLLSAAHPGPKPVPGLARETLQELFRIGDLAGPGVGQLVAPAPRRYVKLSEELYVLLGGQPEVSSQSSSLVRLVGEVPTDGRLLPLDLWLDYRRAVELGEDWLATQIEPWLESDPVPVEEVHSVYDARRNAPHQEGRWRTAPRKVDGPCLVRVRDTIGTYQHMWTQFQADYGLVAHRLHPEGACLLRYSLDIHHRNPVVGRLQQRDDRTQQLWIPSWLPRGEFVLLSALSRSRPQSPRGPWEMSPDHAAVVCHLLQRRLGIKWEEIDEL